MKHFERFFFYTIFVKNEIYMDNTFLSKFTPKETKFFPLFNNLADIIFDVSQKLILCIEHKNIGQDIKEDYEAIKLEEKKADKITTEILNQLSKTFITPFDREDIHELANCLDDVIDEIHSCAKKIYLYNPKNLSSETAAIAELLKKGALQIKNAISGLENIKKKHSDISFSCEEIHDLENEGDDIYAQFISALFRDEKDPIEIIKLKDIVAELEKATDCADHVGKSLRTILVKYS